jgi:methionyl aminopeptidase
LAHNDRSAAGNANQKKKKKKKKPKKKAKGGEVKQTDPPRVGLSKIFTDGIYPEGETHEYPK